MQAVEAETKQQIAATQKKGKGEYESQTIPIQKNQNKHNGQKEHKRIIIPQSKKRY